MDVALAQCRFSTTSNRSNARWGSGKKQELQINAALKASSCHPSPIHFVLFVKQGSLPEEPICLFYGLDRRSNRQLRQVGARPWNLSAAGKTEASKYTRTENAENYDEGDNGREGKADLGWLGRGLARRGWLGRGGSEETVSAARSCPPPALPPIDTTSLQHSSANCTTLF